MMLAIVVVELIVLLLLIFLYSLYMSKKLSAMPWISNHIHHSKVYLAIIMIAVFAMLLVRGVAIGILLYVFLFYLICDLIGYLCRLTKKEKVIHTFDKLYCYGIPVIVLAIAVTAFSAWNVRQIMFKHYNVTVEKQMQTKYGLDILTLSDMHLGTAVHEEDLKQIVNKVNEYGADIVCLTGDIFDENTTDSLLKASYSLLGKMKSNYGVFYVTGNHEYFRSDIDTITKNLTKQGIHVLKDESYEIPKVCTIVGRKDVYCQSKEGSRAPLKKLLKNVNESLPVILLDHQPKDLTLAKESGVDLQLSGHTHAGQIIPFDLVAKMTNEMNYGMKQDGSYTTIVTSGVGVWGYPLRNGSHSEIVTIHMESE